MVLDTDAGTRSTTDELQSAIMDYQLGAGTSMRDISIPGVETDSPILLRVITPASLPKLAPAVLDIHGGGFTSGSVDIDNYRCISLAESTACIVVSVDYRLATRSLPFPNQLLDCYQAYRWLQQNGTDLGIDPTRIAVHGTSAGGNLAAALALYLRDRGEQAPALTVLNCPCLTDQTTPSKLQYGDLSGTDRYYDTMEAIYLNADGHSRAYYAMPLDCNNLRGLGPHMLVVAEYDPLRDEGIKYATKLLYDGVPCELICAPRVTHGFCVIDKPLTHWVHRTIAASLRREFGMEITEI